MYSVVQQLYDYSAALNRPAYVCPVEEQISAKDRMLQKRGQLLAYMLGRQTVSAIEISEHFGWSLYTVYKYLNQLRADGSVSTGKMRPRIWKANK